MRSTCIMLALSLTPAAPSGNAARLRARAALALEFADAGRPAYAELYAKAVREGKPLVVWVGQPAAELPGFVVAACDSFPGVGPVAVVVGVPVGGVLRRVDLSGRPTADAIRAAAREVTTAALPVPR